MATVAQPSLEKAVPKKTPHESTLVRVSRYVVVRLATLFVTVVIGIYLTIMIANMGGYVDKIMRGEIRERITGSIVGNAAFVKMDPAVRQKLVEERIAAEEDRIGLNVPIAIRNFRYLSNGLTLQLGRAINMTSDSGSKQVRLILLERLPATLLLMGISELFLFFSSVLLALNLSRRYGNFWDKLRALFVRDARVIFPDPAKQILPPPLAASVSLPVAREHYRSLPHQRGGDLSSGWLEPKAASAHDPQC